MTMQTKEHSTKRRRTLGLFCAAAGVAVGVAVSQGIAAMSPPSEHKGLDVKGLGVIPESSMQTTIGLDGRKLQLRAITIEPGGQIAKHSHETRPGLVQVISGEWVEGRPAGEQTYGAQDAGIVEDEDTVHWFYNRGEEPATAIVCDIVPES